jgi:hypothetical protein
MFTACSTIDIQNVEPEKLKISVEMTRLEHTTNLDVFLSRGLWSQPVRVAEDNIHVSLTDGSQIALIPSRHKGRYGFRQSLKAPIEAITVGEYGPQVFPETTSVSMTGMAQFEGRSYFKDDLLVLDLPEANGDQRYLVATGHCGGQQFTAERKIPTNSASVELSIGSVMNQINNAAEADLNGVIPVSLAIEERYTPQWPSPFIASQLSVRDQIEISIDTSGFRFKAKVSLNLANNVWLNFQNQQWPVSYCY